MYATRCTIRYGARLGSVVSSWAPRLLALTLGGTSLVACGDDDPSPADSNGETPAEEDAGTGNESPRSTVPAGAFDAISFAPSGVLMPPDEDPMMTDADSAGVGELEVPTAQEEDSGDGFWVIQEDVNGDGVLDDVNVVVDDEEGTTYVWFEVPSECEDGSAGTEQVLFINDGTTRQVLVASNCPETEDLIIACWLSEEGDPLSCELCALQGEELACVPIQDEPGNELGGDAGSDEQPR